MSKMDNLRAMREAKYARAAALGKEASKDATKGPTKKAAPAKAKTTPKLGPADADPMTATTDSEDLCGHRNMSGRTCTREKGHSAKSHRYS